MTLAQLLEHLERELPYDYLCGGAAETLSRALAGEHPDPLAGEVIALIAKAAERVDADAPIERAAAVTALGPIRLKYMADDAPVEGFRFIERTILGIDAAFDAEALAAKRKGG